MSKDNSRRDFIKKSAALAVGSFLLSDIKSDVLNCENDSVLNKEPFTEKLAFSLPALPYSYDALEPHIDKLTMEIHHSKHHQAYITNLNKALEIVDGSLVGNNFEIESILGSIDKLPVSNSNR